MVCHILKILGSCFARVWPSLDPKGIAGLRGFQDRRLGMRVTDDHVLPFLWGFRAEILVDRLEFEVLAGFEKEREEERIVDSKLLEPGLDICDLVWPHVGILLFEDGIQE